MKTIKLTTLAALTLASTISFAALPKSSGAYAEVTAGYANASGTANHKWSKISKWLGGTLAVGYKFNMFMGAELDVIHFSNHQFNNGSESRDNNGLALMGKGIMPFSNGANLFGKLGYGHFTADLSGAASGNGKQKGNTLLLGAGTSLYVDQNIGLTVQGLFAAKKGVIPNQYMASIGFTYIF